METENVRRCRGLELLGSEASHDLDRLQILIDVTELQISGYQAADWLREHEHLDVGLSDHARILATISIADDTTTTERLLRALQLIADAAGNPPDTRGAAIFSDACASRA